MRLNTLILLLAFLAIMFLIPNSSKASHCAGGEITYEWLSDSTYRMYFKFYRDCTGSMEGSGVTMCYKNACNSFANTLTLYKVQGNLPDGSANGSPVYKGCPGFPDKCQTTSAPIPGLREWWYTNTLTLPFKCNYWTFSVSINARNSSANLVGTPNFHVEATLDNVHAQGNSSPYFSVKPVPYVCVNQGYTYNNGAIDPNSDSLAFELVQPMAANSCTVPSPPASFQSATPSYNTSNNPFQTNNSFGLSTSSGQMGFTPTLQGAQTMSVRVKEFRNGVQIGSTMRDIQFQVLNCSSPPITLNIKPPTIVGATYTNGRIEGCAGAPLSFCFDLRANPSTTKMSVSDNHVSATPGSAMNYQHQYTDSVRGCFSWTPNPLDTGTRILTVTAKDTTCTSPGIAISQTFLIPLYIRPATYILPDTGICLGDSIQLTAVGGSVFTWNVLPGGSSTSSLSCLNCKSPFAKPTTTTQYTVVSNLNSVCLHNKDTVTVTVVSTRPSKPTAASNSPLCVGDTLRLLGPSLSTGFTYLWVGGNWFKSTLQNPVINKLQLIDSGYYILRVLDRGCSSLPDSINVIVSEKPDPVVSSPIRYCLNDPTVPLTATGTNLKWYLNLNGGTPLAGPPTPSSATQGVFNWYVSQSNHCGESQRSQVSVIVSIKSPMPAGNDVTYCKGSTTVPLTANGVNLKWYTTATGGTALPAAPVPSSAVPGVYEWYVSQFATCAESDRDTVTVNIITQPAPIVSDITYCQNSPAAQLTASGNGLLWFNSPAGGVGDTLAPTPSTVATGTYYFYVSQTINGCESERAVIKVLVVPPPTIQLKTSKDQICIYDSVMIENLASNVSSVSYYWTPDKGYILDTGNKFIVTKWGASGTKTVILELKDGVCVIRDSVKVLVLDPPLASFEISQSACEGQLVNIYPSLQNGWYYWTIDGQTITDTVYNKSYQFTWNSKGDKVIRLGMTGKNGCVAAVFEKSIRIHENPVGKIESVSKTNVCEGDTVLFQATPNVYYTYEWSPQGFFLNANAPYVTAVVDGSATIKMTISNEWGCSVTDQVNISTEHCCDIVFPDAFTPNGDGINDMFRTISTTGKYAIHTFMILNRWGKVLFESQEVGAGWDGTFNGEPQDIATYYYFIKYICEGKTIDKKGNFILLR